MKCVSSVNTYIDEIKMSTRHLNQTDKKKIKKKKKKKNKKNK